ncbi:polysaccharide pyruvyl transferase family protein [Glutamicibacter arilaitensis]|uniref:polysaccharide pyruvyl transferase family protein n=1 Tax=Glutamicibacter arilaitensis TaxID=256701 RepID=UPI003FD637A7
MKNFGDEVSPLVLRELLNKNFRKGRISNAQYLGVGSVLNTALRDGFSGTIVGSGLRKPLEVPLDVSSAPNFVGVRGKLTARSLGLSDHLVIGDPGLAVSQIFPRAQFETNLNSLVLLPHFEVLNSAQGRVLIDDFARQGWKILLPNLSPETIAKEIRTAGFVATSSLHGYIFSHAFGVPTDLVSFGSSSNEPEFKFSDYLSIFDLIPKRTTAEELVDYSLVELIDRVEEPTSIISSRIDILLNNMYEKTKGH